MSNSYLKNSFIIGLSIFFGLSILGFFIGSSVIKFKEFERTVTVKGLSEKEFPADIALWPIQFTSAHNDLPSLYSSLEQDTEEILKFLTSNGFEESEISIGIPAITDKFAQQYGNQDKIELRYTASQKVTVYSKKVDKVRETMRKMVAIGKKGIVITGSNYQNKTEFIFTRLNEIKPAMIEEATRKAREVAVKFAKDSNSKLGKIKKARQGQFSIRDRDKNTLHIKKIRVVSTIEYFLSD